MAWRGVAEGGGKCVRGKKGVGGKKSRDAAVSGDAGNNQVVRVWVVVLERFCKATNFLGWARARAIIVLSVANFSLCWLAGR